MDYFRHAGILLILLSASIAAQTSAPQSDGTTPLHWAVRSGDVPAVRRLLRAGANPSVANRYGITPLFLAATNGDDAMIEILLEGGANPKANLTGGQTILM